MYTVRLNNWTAICMTNILPILECNEMHAPSSPGLYMALSVWMKIDLVLLSKSTLTESSNVKPPVAVKFMASSALHRLHGFKVFGTWLHDKNT